MGQTISQKKFNQKVSERTTNFRTLLGGRGAMSTEILRPRIKEPIKIWVTPTRIFTGKRNKHSSYYG